MKSTVYLGLGSNKGDKKNNIRTAVALLAERVGDILALSSLYETEPWGFVSEHTFLNAALKIQTELLPLDLLEVTQRIEIEMGRTEKSNGAYLDRIIDIDILMYGDRSMRTAELILPHPFMSEREFVMAPMAEIASEVEHPVLYQTIGELYVLLKAQKKQ